MNKTSNYQLNQWAKSDQVRMEDFNADNAKIDAAIKAVAGSVPRFITGSYVGDGSATRHFPLPGRPKVVLIYAEHRSVSGFYTTGMLATEICYWNFTSRHDVSLIAPTDNLVLEDDGFSITAASGLNSTGYHQHYLAVV